LRVTDDRERDSEVRAWALRHLLRANRPPIPLGAGRTVGYSTSVSGGNPRSQMRIISASRRTDIPAFYSRWLFNRLHAGFCHWINPFAGQVYRTSLAPDDIIALALWTRDPRPVLKRLGELDDLGFKGRYYFHVTLNAYPKSLDPYVPEAAALLPALRALSAAIGPNRIIWRYDPIILTNGGPFTGEWHVEQFTRLAEELRGHTHSCYFSFATYYGKTSRRLGNVARSTGLAFDTEPSLDQRHLIVASLARIAADHGIRMYSCCGPDLVSPEISQGHCVDADLVQTLRPDLKLGLVGAPSRKGCGCFESTDIGAFDTCLFGCEYCYATVSHSAAQKRHRLHDPNDTILWRPSTMRAKNLDALGIELKPGKSSVKPSQGRQESLL
jgi:hypothetical protein